MTSILLLGLFIGMQHALEADHLAAVSAIAARQRSVRRIVAHGAIWGLGHTLTLMAVAGGAVVLGVAIGPDLSAALETAVGVMLVGLGGHLVVRLIRDRIHFHMHVHKNGHGPGQGDVVHFHAHAHAGETEDHARSDHDHEHPERFPVRTLLVGLMHGLAGSAALLVLTASTVESAGLGFAYIVLFGVGSMAGMAALSMVIAVPLAYSARVLTWANRAVQGGVGAATMALGLYVIYENAAVYLAA